MDPQIIALVIGVAFLGWNLGANDASNCFGASVSSKIVSYKLAIILCSLFLILGALFQGSNGIETYQAISPQSIQIALAVSFASAFSMFMANSLKLALSTSQAVVGAMVGISVVNHTFNLEPVLKIVLCWLLVPFSSLFISWIVYYILFNIFKRLNIGILTHDIIIRYLILLIGCYASYALGANNVANVVGALPQDIGKFNFSNLDLSLIAAFLIALGVITYSKKIMYVVGRGILKIDGFGALVTVLASAITLHIFAFVGVPVSSNHSIIGALFGVGLIRGGTEIHYKKLSSIFVGWFVSPLISCVLAIAIYTIVTR